jgi:hypothetical protein
VIFDPFGSAKPRLSRQGKKAPFRVNPKQDPAFRPKSRRVDLEEGRGKSEVEKNYLPLTKSHIKKLFQFFQ